MLNRIRDLVVCRPNQADKKISRSESTNFILLEHIVLNLGLKENPLVIKRSVYFALKYVKLAS